MPLFKKKLTEQEAALHFVGYIMNEASSVWPTILEDLKNSFEGQFVLEREKMANFDLVLAAIALDLQAIKNLFPNNQAERIEKWVYEFFNPLYWGEYAVEEIKKYGKEFQEHTPNMYVGTNPLSAVSARLLHRWLGENIHNFEIDMGGFSNDEKTSIVSINPQLQMMVDSSLIGFIGTWKRLKDKFKLIEGDLPLDENIQAFCVRDSLRDWESEPESDDKIMNGTDEMKPEGAIEYCDANGCIKEMWLSPEQLNELFKKDLVRKSYKVLFKGPWDGIKEADWPLSEAEANKFIDEKSYAYGICVYVKGEPTYCLMTKQLWEKDDTFQKISNQAGNQAATIAVNPHLSVEKKQEKIAEIFSEHSRRIGAKIKKLLKE